MALDGRFMYNRFDKSTDLAVYLLHRRKLLDRICSRKLNADYELGYGDSAYLKIREKILTARNKDRRISPLNLPRCNSDSTMTKAGQQQQQGGARIGSAIGTKEGTYMHSIKRWNIYNQQPPPPTDGSGNLLDPEKIKARKKINRHSRSFSEDMYSDSNSVGDALLRNGTGAEVRDEKGASRYERNLEMTKNRPRRTVSVSAAGTDPPRMTTGAGASGKSSSGNLSQFSEKPADSSGKTSSLPTTPSAQRSAKMASSSSTRDKLLGKKRAGVEGVETTNVSGQREVNPENSNISVKSGRGKWAGERVGGSGTARDFAFSGIHHIFDQHSGKGAVTVVRFANESKTLLACGSMDGSISICRARKDPKVLCTFTGHSLGVNDLVWTLNNSHLISVSMDKTIRMWDVAESIFLSKDMPSEAPDGHPSVLSKNCTRCIECASEVLTCKLHPLNNNCLFVGTMNRNVIAYNLSTGQQYPGSAKLSAPVRTFALNSSGTALWAGDEKGYVYCFKIEFQTKVSMVAVSKTLVDKNPITWLSHFASTSRLKVEEPLLLINCRSNCMLLLACDDKRGSLRLKRKFKVQHQVLLDIRSCISQSALLEEVETACVVSGSENGTVLLFDVNKKDATHGSLVNVLQGHGAAVLDVSWNSNESLLASCDSQGQIIVWRRAAGGHPSKDAAKK
eukprot:Nk52_evm108s352 gene=Nk52_evmTU108s352